MLSITVIVQTLIMLCAGIAIWLTQQKSRPEWKKYAPIIGLAGEPFWLYTSFIHGQWGIFALTIFYSYSWALGLYNEWFKKN